MSSNPFEQPLPNKSVYMRVLRGPSWGTSLVTNPRNLLRPLFVVYESESLWQRGSLLRHKYARDLGRIIRRALKK